MRRKRGELWAMRAYRCASLEPSACSFANPCKSTAISIAKRVSNRSRGRLSTVPFLLTLLLKVLHTDPAYFHRHVNPYHIHHAPHIAVRSNIPVRPRERHLSKSVRGAYHIVRRFE